MLKTAGRATPILNYIVVILLFGLFVLQLVPFWSNADAVAAGEEVTEISIQEYTWFCDTKRPVSPGNIMSDYFEKNYDRAAGDIILMPVILVACCIITFFFGIKKPTRLWMNIVYIIAGGLALVTYLTDPLYQMGNLYIVHLAVSALLVVATVLNVAIRPWKKIIHYMKTGE